MERGKTNFTEEQKEALNKFIQETVDRETLHDTLRRLERQVEGVVGSNSSYTTERRLNKLLETDLFKQPEPELDTNNVDDPERNF
mgnify:CR=1 FL=1|jgi:hypothetical protein